MLFGSGPIQIRPAPATRRAKSSFSERKPYPGWTASAPAERARVSFSDAPAAVVGLADQPLVGAEAYRRVAASYADGARLAFATYEGRRANPVLIAREYWPEAMTLTGDEGARVLFRRHAAVAVPCDDAGAATDVDTPQDLADLESRWRSTTASE